MRIIGVDTTARVQEHLPKSASRDRRRPTISISVCRPQAARDKYPCTERLLEVPEKKGFVEVAELLTIAHHRR